jgi:hypothetical protein
MCPKDGYIAPISMRTLNRGKSANFAGEGGRVEGVERRVKREGGLVSCIHNGGGGGVGYL